jgi:prophage DNA circulation protein
MEKLLNGSFRGVPFGTSAHSFEGGRRTAAHEFPFKDVSYVEDLGLKAPSLSMDLFVFADERGFYGRDQLRKALDQKGPGLLVHPYLGSIRVQVTSYSLSESYDEGGIARFSVSFVAPGQLESPKAETGTSAAVSGLSLSANLKAGSNAASIDVSKSKARAQVGSVTSSLAQTLQTSARQTARPSSLAGHDRETALSAMSSFQVESREMALLVGTPDLVCFRYADLTSRLSSLGMSARESVTAYLRLFGDVKALFGRLRFPSTALGSVMAANAKLLQDAVYTAVVGSLASAAVMAEWPTMTAATEARGLLAGVFDAAMHGISDDALFGLLLDLKALTLKAVPDPDYALPNIAMVRVSQPAPSLVLAYDYMAGWTDEQLVIDLNGVRNPWFAPSSNRQSIQVLR